MNKIDGCCPISQFLSMAEIVKKEIVKCLKEGCPFKEKLNNYCLKHQIEHYLNETKNAGLKVCANYVRGCRVQNPITYTRSKCAGCLEKERLIEHKKRKEIATEENKKQCSACARLLPLDQYVGTRGETKTCHGCRESNKRADLKRDKEHVKEIANKNAAKPERKAVKKAWKENNPEKVASYWLEATKRLIENDLEGYLKKNAEKSKKWREENPEKVIEINKNKTQNIDLQYNVYKFSANNKRMNFEINKEEYVDLVKIPCYYCGIIQDKGFNGIDRLDSNKNYIKDNCVSCCEMCNMMKGTSSPTIFVHRAEHILTYLKQVNGKLYPDDFNNIKGCSFSDYMNRATAKKLQFEITKEFFHIKRYESCYLCGKETTDYHKNGLDRYDNTKGYTEDNVRSCCGNCNYMKRNYEYDKVISKINLIYKYQQLSPIKKDEFRELRQTVVGNKLTSEEIQENIKNRKEKQRKELKDKYGDPEYRKNKAIELALKRKIKQNV
jgi:hypothetical protein